MDLCKTGAEHIKSLQDGRTVYIDGEVVPDVTTHHAFRNSVASARRSTTTRRRRRTSSR
jgi:4-hydroxyphenylacetate 3-monooxygenase